MYNWIKNIVIRTGITLFNIYVDIYIWIQTKDFIRYCRAPKNIEPMHKEWICISSLYYNRAYHICNTFIEDYTDIESEYTEYCGRKKYKFPLDTYEVREHLFLSKKENHYYIRTFFPGYKPGDILEIIQPRSNVEFIYMEYTHPKMTYTIELQLPDGMWIVGNELFTPAFILRLLQQQSVYYVFDLDYNINIMDHEIKNITLSYQSYIVLNKDEYNIQSI